MILSWCVLLIDEVCFLSPLNQSELRLKRRDRRRRNRWASQWSLLLDSEKKKGGWNRRSGRKLAGEVAESQNLKFMLKFKPNILLAIFCLCFPSLHQNCEETKQRSLAWAPHPQPPLERVVYTNTQKPWPTRLQPSPFTDQNYGPTRQQQRGRMWDPRRSSALDFTVCIHLHSTTLDFA